MIKPLLQRLLRFLIPGQDLPCIHELPTDSKKDPPVGILEKVFLNNVYILLQQPMSLPLRAFPFEPENNKGIPFIGRKHIPHMVMGHQLFQEMEHHFFPIQPLLSRFTLLLPYFHDSYCLHAFAAVHHLLDGFALHRPFSSSGPGRHVIDHLFDGFLIDILL